MDLLTNGIKEKLDDIGRKKNLSQEDLKKSLKEIRNVLVEADVDYFVAKDFVKNVESKSLNGEILKGLNPGEQVIKIVRDEMINLLEGNNELDLSKNDIIMMVGLQGTGKTTTTGKLGNLLRKKNKKNPLLVALDVYRPAAIEQLKTLGKQLNISVYSEDGTDVMQIAKNAVKYANENNYNLIIFDTAGRTHEDQKMMLEVKELKQQYNPSEVLLVLDGSTGNIATDVAKSFKEYVDPTGVIFTKMDSDTRGGAIFSVKSTIGKNIKFLGTSEKMDGLEIFDAQRVVGRILGEGDVLGLIEKVELYNEDMDVEKTADRFLSGKFDLNDFLDQMNMMKKMGGLKSIMKLIPGANKLDTSMVDEKEFVRIQAIIESMTPQERSNPSILNARRRIRISKGSATTVQQVNQLIKKYDESKKMMKKMGNMKNMDLSKMGDLFK